MDFQRNNLDKAASPYLRQHADNPVWWQEWTPGVLDHAREADRPLLVSVGYSTCHWCHVMAAEAFSDPECAEILNRDFVSIKVDREQRPDIDQYLMNFLVATTRQGGWPLNAFVTPDGKPFFAMTYASTTPRFSMPAFSDILVQVRDFYHKRKGEIRDYNPAPTEIRSVSAGSSETDSDSEFAEAITALEPLFDTDHAGFGTSQKFPPHALLLFLLYGASAYEGEAAGERALDLATRTLDVMQARGLHDHLQGGFFRYCVDRSWTIPHFEKMLYDQACLLWAYSLAAGLTRRPDYVETAAGIFNSLEETFRTGDLYAAAHDADTNHHEGQTYLWTEDEIGEVVAGPEREMFLRTFEVSESGNFEGRNHLVKRETDSRGHGGEIDQAALSRAKSALLDARRRRDQPFRDDKLLVAWNALAGCGLAAAHRYAGIPGTLDRAGEIAGAILASCRDGVVPHEINDAGRDRRFLTDHAALALLLQMLTEETDRFAEAATGLVEGLARFRNGGVWQESDNADFRPVPAERYDQPTPSGAALADMVELRDRICRHEQYTITVLPDPLAHGFAGITALVSGGLFHVVESPRAVPWAWLPPNAIQIRGDNLSDCYKGVCHMNLDHLQSAGKNST